MPAYRVRPVPVAEVHKRVNPLAVIFMSFEQFLHSREERRPDTDAAGRGRRRRFSGQAAAGNP